MKKQQEISKEDIEMIEAEILKVISDTFGIATACADKLFFYDVNDHLEWVEKVAKPLQKVK